jgi:SAM-dependent methyltransferase
LRGLEVGGPSVVFSRSGLLPLYEVLASVNGVQWSASTTWHELDPRHGYRPEGVRTGELHLLDDVGLGDLGDGSYDLVFSSHVLEHIANPLRALAAWRRVTRADGYMLIVAPHMQGTFDHARSLTPLAHMVEDFEREVDEDDLTHLDETLRLHDRTRDVVIDEESWARERSENPRTRLLHHHTFTTPSLLALLDYAGLELLAAETRFPHDIYAMGRWPANAEPPDNEQFLASPHSTPFRADRVAARRAVRAPGSSVP